MKQVSIQSRFLFVIFALGALQLLEGLFRKLVALLRIVLVLLSLWLVGQSNSMMSTNGTSFEWVRRNAKGKVKEFLASRVTRLVINWLLSSLRKDEAENKEKQDGGAKPSEARELAILASSRSAAPEQPLSEKRIALEQWEEEEARDAQLKEEKANRKRRTDNRKQEKRMARGADHTRQRQTCADCRTLAKSRETKRGENASSHTATSGACQECRGRRQVNNPPPEATEAAEGSPKIKLDTVVKAFEDIVVAAAEENSKTDVKEAPTDVTKEDTTPAD
ncbi:hypothetical protein B0J13DRAFT_681354 [Dactylonectria estremocensis]|uniref:Transmembrane protein n=1 Tax=Dactylonectria estremocensis TaxID=1079267 RepID=A0A9P9DAM6_9HYPO|nr:hypothetical protein B0J13DRAFT_681354 [Dactylonectria estremocensis]